MFHTPLRQKVSPAQTCEVVPVYKDILLAIKYYLKSIIFHARGNLREKSRAWTEKVEVETDSVSDAVFMTLRSGCGRT